MFVVRVVVLIVKREREREYTESFFELLNKRIEDLTRSYIIMPIVGYFDVGKDLT